MKAILIFLIRLYRLAIRPMTLSIGGCRYVPSCSEYAELSIRRHGAGRGFLKTTARILRCHPFARGGVDYP